MIKCIILFLEFKISQNGNRYYKIIKQYDYIANYILDILLYASDYYCF